MTVRSLKRLGISLVAALALTGCGNGNQDTANMLRQLPTTLLQRNQEPQPLTPQQIAQGLAQSTKPVALFEIVSRGNAQFLLQEIERNGPHQTFGNVARIAIVLRDGMITSTRGLGGDLMSSEEDQLLAYVSAGREGRVSYDMRFLTPEDVTIVRRYSCYVNPGEKLAIAAGMIQTNAQVVTVDCTAADGYSSDFSNAYAVSADGHILKGKQWTGPTIGYVNTQVLRR